MNLSFNTRKKLFTTRFWNLLQNVGAAAYKKVLERGSIKMGDGIKGIIRTILSSRTIFLIKVHFFQARAFIREKRGATGLGRGKVF